MTGNDSGSASGNQQNSQTNAQVNSLIVKLPAFWQNSPATWFVQAESQFALGKITADVSKYNYVVAALPPEIAESISDLLLSPPATGLYEKLKDTLVERHSLSLEARIKKLTSDEEMGDKKPSEFFRSLQRLAGNSGTVGDELLKKLWMSRLPQAVNVGLIAQRDEEVSKLLTLADAIWEAVKVSSVAAISSSHSGASNFQSGVPSLNELHCEISALRQEIAKLASSGFRNRSRSRSRSDNRSGGRSQSRPRSSGRYNAEGRLCYYHFKFRTRARDCEPGCAWVDKSPHSGSNSGNRSNKDNPN